MYIGIFLKIILLVLVLMLFSRSVHLVKIYKNRPGPLVRNSDGDFLLVVLLFLVINKSYFEKYKLSYEPIIRHTYTILVFLFLSYLLIQLTQFVLLAEESIVFDNKLISYKDIVKITSKKGLIRYKITIRYKEKNKNKSSYFKVSEKASQEFANKAKEHNIKTSPS